MSEPPRLISVYATVYNNARTLNASIDSVMRQVSKCTKEFEFVVVDNFSTDGTYELLEKVAAKYNNFGLFRAHCTRGEGRQLAYEQTSGRYVFYIDLDTLYLNPLSSIIGHAVDLCKTGIVINCPAIGLGLMDRPTMDRIGGWSNLNMTEDIEFFARAVRRGADVCMIPAHCFENQVMPHRERRYSEGNIMHVLRMLRNAEDKIVGNGISDIGYVARRKRSTALLSKFAYLKLKATHKSTTGYSTFPNNEEYLLSQAHFISPGALGIDERYHAIELPLARITQRDHDTCNLLLERLAGLSFDRIRFLSGRSLLVFKDATNEDVVDYYQAFVDSVTKRESEWTCKHQQTMTK